MIAVAFETPPPSRSSAGEVGEVEVEAVVELRRCRKRSGHATNDAKVVEM